MGKNKQLVIPKDTELFFEVKSFKKESSKSKNQSSNPKNKKICDNSSMLLKALLFSREVKECFFIQLSESEIGFIFTGV